MWIPRKALGRAFLILLLAAGCGEEPKGPKDVTIVQASTALRYPAMLDAASAQLRVREAKATERLPSLTSAIDGISDTDWKVVGEIVDASDEAGKDGGYAVARRELDSTYAFFKEEKEPIVKKVGGAVQFAGKQKNCDPDAWGAINSSLGDSVDERIRERLRSSNDAFVLIRRHEAALGKKNVPALEKLADEISETSYVVHTEVPEGKAVLEAVLAGASGARSSLDALIEDEKAYQSSGKRTNEETKASLARIREAEEKRSAIDAAEQAAKDNLKDIEQRSADLQKAYDDALGKLKQAIAAKAEAAPAKK